MEIDKRPQTIGGPFDDIAPTHGCRSSMMAGSVVPIRRKQSLYKPDIRDGEPVLDMATGAGDMAIRAAFMAGRSIPPRHLRVMEGP